jgi:hypothetical protein
MAEVNILCVAAPGVGASPIARLSCPRLPAIATQDSGWRRQWRTLPGLLVSLRLGAILVGFFFYRRTAARRHQAITVIVWM